MCLAQGHNTVMLETVAPKKNLKCKKAKKGAVKMSQLLIRRYVSSIMHSNKFIP